MNSNDIKALLSLKYQSPIYAFFTEVGNGTGFNCNGYADAIACALYPSMGLEISGFEIKSVRSDWLHELKHPEKSSDFIEHCGRWWLVANKGVAFVEEIPKNWGFMELINDRFYIRKRAPELKAKFDKVFVAALLRRATENVVPKSTVYKLQEKAREDAKKQYEDRIETAEENLSILRKQVGEFEDALGFKIAGWSVTIPDRAARCIKFISSGEFQRIDFDVIQTISYMETMVKRLNEYKELFQSDKLRELKP